VGRNPDGSLPEDAGAAQRPRGNINQPTFEAVGFINVRNKVVHPPDKIQSVDWPSGKELLRPGRPERSSLEGSLHVVRRALTNRTTTTGPALRGEGSGRPTAKRFKL
jgi:hypothetical protein